MWRYMTKVKGIHDLATIVCLYKTLWQSIHEMYDFTSWRWVEERLHSPESLDICAKFDAIHPITVMEIFLKPTLTRADVIFINRYPIIPASVQIQHVLHIYLHLKGPIVNQRSHIKASFWDVTHTHTHTSGSMQTHIWCMCCTTNLRVVLLWAI